MGRPLNKRNFGDPARTGNQLVVTATVGVANNAITTYIIAQKTNTKYIVQGVEGPVLCDVVETFSGPNQMRILADFVEGTNIPVRSLHANRLKTFEGSDVPWGYEAPTGFKFQISGG